MTNILAKSKAGHDKGHIYVVINEDSDNVWLADGKLKMVDHPKRKNKKHIQVITHLSEEIRSLLNIEETLTDLTVKRVLKLYETKIKQEEN